jgi:hypothetical protein
MARRPSLLKTPPDDYEVANPALTSLLQVVSPCRRLADVSGSFHPFYSRCVLGDYALGEILVVMDKGPCSLTWSQDDPETIIGLPIDVSRTHAQAKR